MHMLHVHAGHLNEIFAMPHQRTNLANGMFGTKRGFQQTHRMQILKPLAIQHVGFAARNVMHMLSIDQMNFNTASLKDLEQRYPVDASGFHGHRVDAALLQPVGQDMQILCKRGKRSHRFGISVGGHGDKDLPGSEVNTSSVGSHYRQTSVQLSMLPSLCFGHGSSPFVKTTSQACKIWKSLKRDHRNANSGCASPMLWRTGLGSNSLTGSPKLAPLGKRPTLTVAVSDSVHDGRDWTK